VFSALVAVGGTAAGEVRLGAQLGINASSYYESEPDLWITPLPAEGRTYHAMHPHVRVVAGAFARWPLDAAWQLEIGLQLAHKVSSRTECGFQDCAGIPAQEVTWSVIDLEVPVLASWVHPLATSTDLRLGVGLAPTYSLRAVEHYGNLDDTEIYEFFPFDMAAIVALGIEVAREPYRLGLDLRASLGLIDRNTSEESPLDIHGYGLYVFGSVLYGP
jgi:hypothetical protein